ncbi:hypothetical protein MCETARE7_00031 [Candidatus Nanopelagicaceae bacterium]
MNIRLHFTGLPRFAEVCIPRIVKGTSHQFILSSTFWNLKAVSQDRIETAGPSMKMLRTSYVGTPGDWETIENRIPESMPVEALDFNKYLSHANPLIQEHGLRVAKEAALSWLSAIGIAAEFISSRKMGPQDIVMISRVDLKVNRILLKRLLHNLSHNEFKNVIFLPPRMGEHKIYPSIHGSKKDLPVDHFIIGHFEDIVKFKEMRNFLERYAQGVPPRVPLVSEFVLGDFMELQGIEWKQAKIPYSVWRGDSWRTLSSPFTGVAKKRLLLHVFRISLWKLVLMMGLFQAQRQKLD